MKKSTVFLLALALVLSAVPAFADDTQDAINKAGFGINQNSKEPESSTSVIRDPNAPGGSRYSDQAQQQNAKTDYDVSPRIGVDYKIQTHTYMTYGEYVTKFNVRENQPVLPRVQEAADNMSRTFTYYNYFNERPQTVIGLPPSASDGPIRYPSEPSGLYYEFAGEKIKAPESIYQYSGDQWGDCLGPKCIDRGAFRQPVGSWVHFTQTRIEERNNLSNLLGFPDTIQQISNSVGQPVVELRNGRE